MAFFCVAPSWKLETRINCVLFSNWFTISLNEAAGQLIEHARIRIPKEC